MIIERIKSPRLERRCTEDKIFFLVKLNGYAFEVLLHRKPDCTRVQFLLCPMRRILRMHDMNEEWFLPYVEGLQVGESRIALLDSEIEKEVLDSLFNWKLNSKINIAHHQLSRDCVNLLTKHQ